MARVAFPTPWLAAETDGCLSVAGGDGALAGKCVDTDAEATSNGAKSKTSSKSSTLDDYAHALEMKLTMKSALLDEALRHQRSLEARLGVLEDGLTWKDAQLLAFSSQADEACRDRDVWRERATRLEEENVWLRDILLDREDENAQLLKLLEFQAQQQHMFNSPRRNTGDSSDDLQVRRLMQQMKEQNQKNVLLEEQLRQRGSGGADASREVDEELPELGALPPEVVWATVGRRSADLLCSTSPHLSNWGGSSTNVMAKPVQRSSWENVATGGCIMEEDSDSETATEKESASPDGRDTTECDLTSERLAQSLPAPGNSMDPGAIDGRTPSPIPAANVGTDNAGLDATVEVGNDEVDAFVATMPPDNVQHAASTALVSSQPAIVQAQQKRSVVVQTPVTASSSTSSSLIPGKLHATTNATPPLSPTAIISRPRAQTTAAATPIVPTRECAGTPSVVSSPVSTPVSTNRVVVATPAPAPDLLRSSSTSSTSMLSARRRSATTVDNRFQTPPVAIPAHAATARATGVGSEIAGPGTPPSAAVAAAVQAAQHMQLGRIPEKVARNTPTSVQLSSTASTALSQFYTMQQQGCAVTASVSPPSAQGAQAPAAATIPKVYIDYRATKEAVGPAQHQQQPGGATPQQQPSPPQQTRAQPVGSAAAQPTSAAAQTVGSAVASLPSGTPPRQSSPAAATATGATVPASVQPSHAGFTPRSTPPRQSSLAAASATGAAVATTVQPGHTGPFAHTTPRSSPSPYSREIDHKAVVPPIMQMPARRGS